MVSYSQGCRACRVKLMLQFTWHHRTLSGFKANRTTIWLIYPYITRWKLTLGHDTTSCMTSHISLFGLCGYCISVEQRVNILAVRHMTCACVEFRKKLFKFHGLNLNFKTQFIKSQRNPSLWSTKGTHIFIHPTRTAPGPVRATESRRPWPSLQRRHGCMIARHRLSWGFQHKSVIRMKWLYKHLSALLNFCLLACLFIQRKHKDRFWD